MIELLVSSGKPERWLASASEKKVFGQSIEKLIGGDGGAEKGTSSFLFTISTLAKSPRKLYML